MFDYTSKADLQRLSQQVGLIPKAKRASFAGTIMAAGLMRLPWYIRFGINLQIWLRKRTPLQAWTLFFSVMPDVTIEFLKGFQEHLVKGKDTFDKKSAGGYSQPEIKTILEIMLLHGWTEEQEEA